jgi:hypothetical protein
MNMFGDIEELMKNINVNKMSDEELLMLWLVMYFTNYTTYIEELNSDLHKKAIDYANDMTKIPGVSLVYTDKFLTKPKPPD